MKNKTLKGYLGGGLVLPGTGDLISKTVPLKGSGKQINPKGMGLVPNLLYKALLNSGELNPNYGEFNRVLYNEPEPGDRLTPEEGILLELLTQSNKSEASVSPPMLGEVNPYLGEMPMNPPMVEDSDVEEKPIRSPFKSYQSGGYVPGLSQARQGIRLQRDVTTAQEELRKEAEKLEKKQKWKDRISSGVSKFATMFGVPEQFTEGIGEITGGALSGLISGVGDIKGSSKTGLFGGDFEYLRDIEEDMTDPFAITKRAFGSVAGGIGSSLLEGLASDLYSGYKSKVPRDLSQSAFEYRAPLTEGSLTGQDIPKFGKEGAYRGFKLGAPSDSSIVDDFNQSFFGKSLIGGQSPVTSSSFADSNQSYIDWEDLTVLGGSPRYGMQQGGKVGAYSGGKGLLSMAPFSRRII